jgi:hypothetical protein
MKKLHLLKSMLLLCALVVGSSNLWAGDIVVTLDNIGAGLGSTANSTAATTNITATGTTDSYTLNYLQCKKQGNAMLMTKNASPYISNKTPMPGNIKSVQVFINSGASGSTTYDCAFSTTECTSATSSGNTAVNITGGNSYTFSNMTGTPPTINVKGKYFCITLGNAYNGQVLKLVITCENSHTITYSATNGSIGGKVYGTSTDVASGASVAEGGKVTLTATPNDGYEFSSWEVSGTGASLSSTSTNPTDFTMGTANATVTAVFASTSAKYAVSFSTPSNGTLVVKKAGVAISSGDEIASGTVLTIEATPNDGYNLVKWEYSTDDGSNWSDGVGTSYTVTSAVQFRASFVAKVYHTITYSVNGVETETEVEEGEAISFAAPASGIPTGYKFTGWVVAANKIDSPTDTDPKANYVTSANCSADITYYAVMAVSEYTTPTLTKMGSSDTFNADDNIVIVAKGTTYALYQETVSTSYVKNWTFDNAVSTLNADNKKYLTLSSNSDEWYLGDKTNGYLYNGSSNNLALSDSKSSWTINWNSTHKAFTIETNSKYLSCRSDLTGDNQYKYRMLGNTDSGIGFFDIYKFVPSKDGHFCTTVSDVPTKVGAKGYATYCNSSVALDFTGRSIKAYVVKSTNGSALTLTQVNKVAKNTPLLLYSTTNSDSQTIPAIADSETMDDVTGNKLKAGTGAALTWEEGTTEYYILYTGGEKPGFYRANNSIVAVGKAYLDLTGVSGSREFFSFFDDETTGINAIDVENANAEVKNNVYYNLNGQRVANPSKGLYIVNGKKVIMK